MYSGTENPGLEPAHKIVAKIEAGNGAEFAAESERRYPGLHDQMRAARQDNLRLFKLDMQIAMATSQDSGARNGPTAGHGSVCSLTL